MTMIIVSSLMLVIDNPLNNPNSAFTRTFNFIDMVFTILFTAEAMVKIIALGFVHNAGLTSAYLANGWNLLDFFVVTCSLTDLFVG